MARNAEILREWFVTVRTRDEKSKENTGSRKNIFHEGDSRGNNSCHRTQAPSLDQERNSNRRTAIGRDNSDRPIQRVARLEPIEWMLRQEHCDAIS